MVGGYILAIHLGQDVAGPQPSFGSGAVFLNCLRQFATALWQAEGQGQILVDGLEADAKIAALDFLTIAQLLDDRRGDFGWDRKTDPDTATRRREDRVVDADHVAAHVEQWAA